MQLVFEQDEDSQGITISELNQFESLIVYKLPEDYRQHMLTHNGSTILNDVFHVNYPDGGGAVSYFYPIKYGSDTMEKVFSDLNGKLPVGFISIGKTDTGGQVIMSLNNDDTYGKINEFFADGDMFDLSPSFTQLLNDMVENGIEDDEGE